MVTIQEMAKEELRRRRNTSVQSPQDMARIELERRRAAAPPSAIGDLGIAPPRTTTPSSLEKLTGRPDALQQVIPQELAPYVPNRLTTGVTAFGQAATLGNFDKIAALPALMNPEVTYDEARQGLRESYMRGREEYPATSLGGDVAGFLGPGGIVASGLVKAAGPVMRGAQRMGPALGFGAKTGVAAGIGATDAALYGATVQAEQDAMSGGLEGPTGETRAQTAAEMAPMGALIGGAMPSVGVALRPVGRAISGTAAKIGEAIGITPGSAQRFNERVGKEAARRSLERAGILNLDDLMKRAAEYGDKPVVTAELGQDPLNSLVALVRGKGTTGEKAMAVLEDRVAGMPGRMLKDIAEQTGMKPEDVFGTIDDMVKASRARAAPAYEAAEAAPFAPSPNLDRIMDAPIIQGLLGRARGRVGNQAVAQISSPEGMPPLKLYDETKQLLDEEITRRLAQGEGIDDVEAIRRALVEELDLISAQGADYGVPRQITAPSASPYAMAREVGGDAPRIIEGQRLGEKALSGSQLAEDVAREVATMRGGALTAYQAGVIRNMVKSIEGGNLSPKRIKSKGFADKLKAVFGEEAAAGIINRFSIEAELSQKGSRWNPNVGSVTSAAMMGGPSKAGDEALRAAANLATGNKVGLTVQLANMLRKQGYSEKQLDEIGKILLSSPEDAGRALFPGQTASPPGGPPRGSAGGGGKAPILPKTPLPERPAGEPDWTYGKVKQPPSDRTRALEVGFRGFSRKEEEYILRSDNAKEFLEKFIDGSPKADPPTGPIATHQEMIEAGNAARRQLAYIFKELRGKPSLGVSHEELQALSWQAAAAMLRRYGYRVQPIMDDIQRQIDNFRLGMAETIQTREGGELPASLMTKLFPERQGAPPMMMQRSDGRTTKQ